MNDADQLRPDAVPSGADERPGSRSAAEAPWRRRVLIISNPTAGPRRSLRLRRVMAHLAGLGASVTVRETTRRGDAEAYAAAADGKDFDVIAVAGGDGTINEVLNGLTKAALPVAVIPLGTANVLAVETGLSLHPRTIARTVMTGGIRPIRLGRANGRRFVMMLGIGFGAEVVARVGPRLKAVAGRSAYIVQSLLTAFRFSRRTYAVTVDGRAYTAASVVVANGRSYGGNFTCAPQASLYQPSLDVCLFHNGGTAAALTYMTALATGRLDRLNSVSIVRGTRIRIEALCAVDGSCFEAVQADGDIALALPLSIDIDPAPLDFVVGTRTDDAGPASR